MEKKRPSQVRALTYPKYLDRSKMLRATGVFNYLRFTAYFYKDKFDSVEVDPELLMEELWESSASSVGNRSCHHIKPTGLIDLCSTYQWGGVRDTSSYHLIEGMAIIPEQDNTDLLVVIPYGSITTVSWYSLGTRLSVAAFRGCDGKKGWGTEHACSFAACTLTWDRVSGRGIRWRVSYGQSGGNGLQTRPVELESYWTDDTTVTEDVVNHFAQQLKEIVSEYNPGPYTLKQSGASLDLKYHREPPSVGKLNTILWKNRFKFEYHFGRSIAYSDELLELQAASFDATRKFSGNLIAYLSEIGSWGGTLNAFADFLEGRSIRDAASAWLSYRYGDRLSVKDSKEIMGALLSMIPSPKTLHTTIRNTRRSRNALRSYWSKIAEEELPLIGGYLASTVYLTPRDENGLMSMIRTLYEWDAYLSLENAWDLIPFSFVVDWFVNVGDILDSCDRLISAQYYNVRDVVLTAKVSVRDPSFPSLTWNGYTRGVGHTLDIRVSDPQFSLPSAINIIDGLSLSIQ